MTGESVHHGTPGTGSHLELLSVQALGLSPLLAVSDTVTKGFGLGLVTAVALIIGCLAASLLRGIVSGSWRLPVYLVILAATVSGIDLLLQLFFFPLHRALGLYVPLICANAALLTRMETVAREVSAPIALLDSMRTATGMLMTLIALAALREWLATGQLLSQLELLRPFPASATAGDPIGTQLSGYRFRFPTLQPGAFLLLGLLVAGVNALTGTLKAGNTRESR